VQTLKVRRTLKGLKEQHHELEEDYQEAQEEAEAAEVKITAAHSRSAAFCPCTVFASQSVHTNNWRCLDTVRAFKLSECKVQAQCALPQSNTRRL